MIKKIVSTILISFLISFLFLPYLNANETISDRDKEYLINLARQTLYWYLKDATIPTPDKDNLSDSIKQKRGCFVTLYKRNWGLRGCVGIFGEKNPLYENIINRAIAAAIHDKRFPKVTYDELKDIKIEITVLTKPKELHFSSYEDLLSKLRPLKDGVILTTRYGQSTYIPQVWKKIPDKEEFLSTLCQKHGAPRDTWKSENRNIQVFTYQAIYFGEELYGRRVIGKKGAIVGRQGANVLGAVKPLREGLIYGGYKVDEGTVLAAGAIVTPNSDVIEK